MTFAHQTWFREHGQTDWSFVGEATTISFSLTTAATATVDIVNGSPEELTRRYPQYRHEPPPGPLRRPRCEPHSVRGVYGVLRRKDAPLAQGKKLVIVESPANVSVVDLDTERCEPFCERDAFLECLVYFFVIERIRRAVDHAPAVRDGGAAEGETCHPFFPAPFDWLSLIAAMRWSANGWSPGLVSKSRWYQTSASARATRAAKTMAKGA